MMTPDDTYKAKEMVYSIAVILALVSLCFIVVQGCGNKTRWVEVLETLED